MDKHTPGPWHVECPHPEDRAIRDAAHNILAGIYGDPTGYPDRNFRPCPTCGPARALIARVYGEEL